jgi:hypothetical protein
MLFIIPFIVGLYLGIKDSLTNDDINIEIMDPEPTVNNSQEKKIVEVGFNEFADIGRYSVKINKIEEIPAEYPLYDGCVNIAIHFVIKNNGNEPVQPWTSKIYCIVNGYSQQNSWVEGYKPIPTHYIDVGMLMDGYCIFRIPVDVETMQIKYGDNIVINIDPQNIQFVEYR